ncbi:MAG: hypothetical protein NTU88_10095 [Armatimonadetes bacterium]|nr:hypothetical protein [Armatimonadota bacterium]
MGTPFQHTHIPLRKWFTAIYLMLVDNKAVSTSEMSRALLVNKNTACYVNARIRRSMLSATQRDLVLAIADMLGEAADE